jgi:hypothetical protein
MKISIKEIRVGREKSRSNENIEKLSESMEEIGQVEPIILNARNEIISGFRRFNAAKALGWTKIEAAYFEKTAVDEELASIDANLMSLPLGDVDHDMALARRKKLYIQKHPNTAQHVSKGEEESFTDEVSGMLGVSSRTIEHAIARAEKAAPVVNDARREGKISSSVVNALVRLPTGYQIKLLPSLMGKSVAQAKHLVDIALERDVEKAIQVASNSAEGSFAEQIKKSLIKATLLLDEAINIDGKFNFADVPGLLDAAKAAKSKITEFMSIQTIPHKTILRKTALQEDQVRA